MKRTLAFLGSVVPLALVVGATIVGATLAQPGQYGHIHAQAEGDDAVVAVVEGENITRGQVRKPAEFRRSNDSTMTESEAKQITILVLVEDTALWAEAKQRKLVPTVSLPIPRQAVWASSLSCSKSIRLRFSDLAIGPG